MIVGYCDAKKSEWQVGGWLVNWYALQLHMIEKLTYEDDILNKKIVIDTILYSVNTGYSAITSK